MDTQNEQVRTNYTLLMERRIRKVLMICSSYDAYILEEDGQIDAQIYKEYIELNLSNPPAFIWETTSAAAFERIHRGEQFDLIICMLNIGDVDVFSFSKAMKAEGNLTPVVLLTNFSKEFLRRIDNEDTQAIDYIFTWNGNADLILAIIKLIEDRMNADKDILERGVQCILLVEDSIRYYSTYLPALYKLVLKQNVEFLSDTLNEQQQKMRKRARPKMLLATNYEDAVSQYNRYKKNLLGVISDVGFVMHKGDRSDAENLNAGIELCKLIKADDPYMPVLLQSSQLSIKEEADRLGVGFILKNSKTLLLELSDYISREFVFGDFMIKSLAEDEIIGRASNLRELQLLMRDISDEELLMQTSRNRLSKWLFSRGLFDLATPIRDVRPEDFVNVAALRSFVINRIRDYRILSGQGVIAKFDPKTYHRYIRFARIGEGSLGGKARGLAFLNRLLWKSRISDKFEGMRISIPQTLVITTDNFDAFILDNGLQYVVNTEGISDDDILSEFVSSRLSDALTEDLKRFVEKVNTPLAVRSSSKLEDSIFQPFAGVYSTYMLPLTDNKDQMVRLLSKAIKSVYASVFFAASRNYIQSTANLLSEEKMAVIVQSLCGSEDKGFFFPTISGVARSINYYPIGHEKPEDGIVNMAFGLGKLVVEGGRTLRFSPRYPKNILQTSSTKSTLSQTQNAFYALNLRPEEFKTSIDDGVNLQLFPISDAELFRNLRYVASTWDMANERIVAGVSAKGRKLITFENILANDAIPLAPALMQLLELCREEMHGDVELEFAVDMDVPEGSDSQLYLLQVRPITNNVDNEEFDWSITEDCKPLIATNQALGPGVIHGVRDVVYIKSEAFDKARTRDIAQEVEALNLRLKQQEKSYMLVGPGRWGSSDPWLGIPIAWSHISEAKVIVEYSLKDFQVDPSEGTHFFQNLTSLGVGYLTVNSFKEKGVFDESQLQQQSSWYESEFVRCVHFDSDLILCADGRASKAWVSLPR